MNNFKTTLTLMLVLAIVGLFPAFAFSQPLVGDQPDSPKEFGDMVLLETTCAWLGKIVSAEALANRVDLDKDDGLLAHDFSQQAQEIKVEIRVSQKCLGKTGFVNVLFDENGNLKYELPEELVASPAVSLDQTSFTITVKFDRPVKFREGGAWLAIVLTEVRLTPLLMAQPLLVLPWGEREDYFLSSLTGAAPYPLFSPPPEDRPVCLKPPCGGNGGNPPPPPPPPPPPDDDGGKCNSGGGNGDEGCDPGNSEGHNCGKDEDSCQDKGKGPKKSTAAPRPRGERGGLGG